MTRTEKRIEYLIKELRFGQICFNALFKNDKTAREKTRKMIDELWKLSERETVSLSNRAYAQDKAHEYTMALLDTSKGVKLL